MFFPSDPTIDALLRGLMLAGIALLIVIGMIRVVGLRSLSKMTNFDFVATVALGSLLAGAGQVETWQAFAQVIAAMAGLFAVQFVLSRLRKGSDDVEDAMQNDPVMLYENGQFCEEALKQRRVTQSDVLAKMREANALSLAEVQAVVLEATGDVSVLHGETLDSELVENVVRL